MSAAPWPESFVRLGLHRPLDLLLHFPLRYEDESQVWPLSHFQTGDSGQCQVVVAEARVVFKPRRTLLIRVTDATGEGILRFLYFKEAMRQSFVAGQKIRVVGQARRLGFGEVEFIHPRIRQGWLTPEALAMQPLVAVYPTTQGLSQAAIRRAVTQALSDHRPDEWLPISWQRRLDLPPLPDALLTLHRPAHPVVEHQMQSAWNRIRFDELLAQQVALRRARLRRAAHRAPRLEDAGGLSRRLLEALPFALTPGQQQAWQQVYTDLCLDRPVHRLIQGDVGSGKTVIAALAAAQAIGSGYQAAVMAPTEILAVQLFEKLTQWLAPLGVETVLLKGGRAASQRREAITRMASQAPCLVVGTHALIQKDIEFGRLGLAIIDEQHRFGVAQRMALRERLVSSDQTTCHILGMSATPIPRSLAMTFLADLDVSVIRDRPEGRLPIQTRLMSQSRREELLARLLQFLDHEGQAYWVCPVIEEQEESDSRQKHGLTALEETQAWLAPVLGDRMVVVHGRMRPEEKSAAMAQFVSGAARLLLATTVIEVGVDVPTARLIVIDHAERFGLAQLHQLRGRVGRGQGQSTCVLLYESPLSEAARDRLKALYETEDGFELANRDLALRGPGEILGMRQSGEVGLRFSDLVRDRALVQAAVDCGQQIAEVFEDAAALKALGLSRGAIEALLDRWARRADDLLSSV
ncbi:MAG: ATP-dependent DNA helicase RecG [Burkholderiaceae bacterium]